MSQDLKAEEFYKIYQEYKSTGIYGALKMLFKISPKVQNNKKKNNVWRIKKIINHYNLGMEDLLVTKSSNLRKKGSGRPRKNKEPNWEIFNRDDLVEIAKRYYEITNKLPKSKQIKESKELNLNYFKLANLFNLCRQTVSKNKRNEYLSNRQNIVKLFFKHLKKQKKDIERKLSVYILQKYKKYINPRSLGRYMNLLGLKCKVRQKKKRKEIKDTNTQIENLVKRDYDDRENRNIFATDVSYIKSPKDVLESFVYLSAILSHKTKEIIALSCQKVTT
ncbi:hypothetical protein ONA02_02395 [Mycoplasmopsis felis]|uniref:hypothetical protein n=1 Tax=Mycoplasmopsis felis TaxID=33923 RepID=UPI0022862CB0|nr:hypothetical protein [Mycoplasmopsis felis]WAM02655.1 hypothetical protein ONA02_02395 [Mycoplasmopsis felis]